MPEILLSCRDLGKSFGAAPLFEGLSFGVFEGDHIGVVGPNGSGKSTLLRILTGIEAPSAGTRSVRKRLRVGYVPQDPVFGERADVGSVLREGVVALGLETHETEVRIDSVMSRAGFADRTQPVATLSGGCKKRLAIIRELVSEPELLLLDEPTNHLDIAGILWLEELLQREPEAFLAVSHDRYFLEAVAGRIIELNRAFAGGFLDVKGRYSDYLQAKDALLAGQAAYQESLRNRVRGELEWLSRKARARTRKSKARIDEAGRLRSELIDLDARSRGPEVAIEFRGTERKTKRLLVARGVTKTYGPRPIVRGLDLLLTHGKRLGLLGDNGSGKTTLLRLLAGSEDPEEGTIERAPDLRIVMFDQHRARLDPDVSLRRTLAPSGDSVIWQARPIHVAGWAKRFLFRPDQLETPVGRLSGGEQARLLIARLMLEPADLLLLDEPTNDLDIPTLEILEESLLEFPGALVLVTHDRFLLDRVSTELLALDGTGGVRHYADYAQWELDQGAADETVSNQPATGRSTPAVSRPETMRTSRKLGYLEQREWNQMESRIRQAEQELAACERAASDPAVASDHQALMVRLAALAAARTAVETLYDRWAELEAKIDAISRE